MDSKKPVKKKLKNIRVVYAAVALRRATHDQLLWQAPIIAFTAQAFLFNIAFGDGANTFYRVFSGLLATGLGLLSWQYFHRNSAFELQTMKKLEAIEKEYFKDIPEPYHAKENPAAEGLASISSKTVWSLAILLISLCGLVPLFEAIISSITQNTW